MTEYAKCSLEELEQKKSELVYAFIGTFYKPKWYLDRLIILNTQISKLKLGK